MCEQSHKRVLIRKCKNKGQEGWFWANAGTAGLYGKIATDIAWLAYTRRFLINIFKYTEHNTNNKQDEEINIFSNLEKSIGIDDEINKF